MKNKFFLILACILRITNCLPAQESESPAVTLQFSPQSPAAGSVWVLSLLIGHPVPDEIAVLAPPFTGPLILDKVVKNPAGEGLTVMEYHFILTDSGTITLDAFTVETPQGQAFTEPFSVNIAAAPGKSAVRRYRLFWEGAPLRLKAGERANIVLRIPGWDSTLLPYRLFSPDVPPGVVLEALPPSTGEQAAGIALHLRIITLGDISLALPARTVNYRNAVFEIPPLRIAADPAHGKTPAHNDDSAALADVLETAAVPPFPEITKAAARYPRLYKRYQKEAEHLFAAAQDLWEQRCIAQSLAELRRAERDLPAGKIFTLVREEAEAGIGLFDTEGEKSKKIFLIAFTVIIFFASAAFVLLFMFFKKLKKALIPLVIFLTAAGAVCLHEYLAAEHFISALAKDCAVRIIPEESSAESGRFLEGETVRVPHDRSLQQDNAYVFAESLRSGVSGWVVKDALIFY